MPVERPKPRGRVGVVVGVIGALVLVGGVTAYVLAPRTEPEIVATDEVADEVEATEQNGALTVASNHHQTQIEEDEIVIFDGTEPEAPSSTKSSKPTKKSPSAKKSTPSTKSSTADAKDEAPDPNRLIELDPDLLRKTLAKKMFHVHRCFDAALDGRPDLNGRIEVAITVARDGGISSADIVSDTLHHGGVNECVLRKVRTWSIPIEGKLYEPVEVTFPVAFR